MGENHKCMSFLCFTSINNSTHKTLQYWLKDIVYYILFLYSLGCHLRRVNMNFLLLLILNEEILHIVSFFSICHISKPFVFSPPQESRHWKWFLSTWLFIFNEITGFQNSIGAPGSQPSANLPNELINGNIRSWLINAERKKGNLGRREKTITSFLLMRKNPTFKNGKEIVEK